MKFIKSVAVVLALSVSSQSAAGLKIVTEKPSSTNEAKEEAWEAAEAAKAADKAEDVSAQKMPSVSEDEKEDSASLLQGQPPSTQEGDDAVTDQEVPRLVEPDMGTSFLETGAEATDAQEPDALPDSVEGPGTTTALPADAQKETRAEKATEEAWEEEQAAKVKAEGDQTPPTAPPTWEGLVETDAGEEAHEMSWEEMDRAAIQADLDRQKNVDVDMNAGATMEDQTPETDAKAPKDEPPTNTAGESSAEKARETAWENSQSKGEDAGVPPTKPADWK